ncbi:hypothetical protein LEL_08438 [Akanthomyces lecanii RCEF 1005]|uniref:Uncharacterized protein n=1 Tax=Akanthomyces lecanii RCEF 1005 TaxID=1081108 RepID=A0A162LM50_CORDF|nr:hypothetical protein LEL_08438 [Akanthomyces lecanii RCEF 1005]
MDLVETLGKNETYAALDGTNGQEFLGSMEVFHQLHCLNLIRKFTYEDYYRKRDPMPFAFRDSPATLRKHVDYLREAIMCAGDVGVYMSFWVENRDIPWPDFEVEHKCRSWDSIVAYANEAAHGIRMPAKPSDAVVFISPRGHHAAVRMASPGPSASAADDGDRLKKAHDELRIVDAETHSLLRELNCLMTAKTLLFPAEHNGPGQAGSTYWRAWYQRKGFGDQPPLESEWWKRAGGRGLLNSAENLQREIEHVEIQGATLVAHRDAVWRAVNALSRPFLRSLSIMNLPEETLLGVLELVEGFDPDLPVSYGMSEGRRDIQNVRLVCQRFCELGSQLLVRRVRVSPNEASLAPLRAVSRHPTIPRGVRAVRVGLQFETSALGDLGTFFSHLHTEAQD